MQKEAKKNKKLTSPKAEKLDHKKEKILQKKSPDEETS